MAATTAGVWIRLLAANTATSAAVAIVLVLVAAQIHAAVLRGRDRRAFVRDIAALRQTGFEYARTLDDTRTKLEEMQSALEARTSAQTRKIFSELQVLESLMREFAAKIADKSSHVALDQEEFFERSTRSSTGAKSDAPEEAGLLEVIRASLEQNRVDLYLQPIVTLPQRKLRFYEALSRLRAQDGSVIMPAQYIKVAGPVGLMSVVDNLLLFRCVQIVRRMAQKTKEIGVFCNISGDTLVDAEFFPQFLEYMHHHRELSGQIIFEFAQASVLDAGTKVEENLKYLAGLGFALSMDHVETLSLDFGRLHQLGFRYMKIQADVLMNGTASAGAAIAGEDLKALLARHNIGLIAEHVENEKEVVQLLDFNVDYGQGFLFGEPRAVREDPKQLLSEDKPASVIPFRKAG
jgi:cyclic-di-GMP phosphodiesterase TipF (flagellum assembly factor)